MSPRDPIHAGCPPGPVKSFMQNPRAVAQLLSVEWYKEQWPSIPPEELDASAVDLPFEVLMHRKRVSQDALDALHAAGHSAPPAALAGA